jgi:hypothetical protein
MTKSDQSPWLSCVLSPPLGHFPTRSLAASNLHLYPCSQSLYYNQSPFLWTCLLGQISQSYHYVCGPQGEKKNVVFKKTCIPVFWPYTMHFLHLLKESKLCYDNLFSWSKRLSRMLSFFKCIFIFFGEISSSKLNFLNGSVYILQKHHTHPGSNNSC